MCSWSSLDHGGGWKLLHHMAKEFFAPVTVVAVPDAGGIILRAVNDTDASVALTVEVNAVGMPGALRAVAKVTVDVGPDAALQVVQLPSDALAPDEVLVFSWTLPDGRREGDVFAPKPWKAYDLLPPMLEQIVKKTTHGFDITISAKALAPFVAVEADLPGRFSTNAFTLFPGHPMTVTFTPTTPGVTPNFTLRDLHSATYGTV